MPVGERLLVSPKTVENHGTGFMRKPGVSSTLELIGHPTKVGISDIDHWKE